MKWIDWKSAGFVIALLGTASTAKAQDPGDGQPPGDREGRERPSAEELVKKYDKDGSGELSATELEQLFKDQRSRMQRGGRRGPGGPEGRGERMSREELMKKYDKDGDGQLSEEERAALREDMRKRRNAE